MLEPLIAQFSSRGMPALETEQGLAELASRLRLWDEHMSTTAYADGDVSGQINVTERTVRFGEGAPEDALTAHLPRLLAASRTAVAAGTPVVVMSECTLVPPVLAAVRERHPASRSSGSTRTATSTPPRRRPAASSAACRSRSCSAGASTTGAASPASSRRCRKSAPCSSAAAISIRESAKPSTARACTSRMTLSGRWPRLPPDAPLYVHVDTDVLDPSLTPDAGFPAPGGWSVERLRAELEVLGASGRVVALSICPSAPPALDAEGLAPLVEALRRG